jgi:hypothetical protein
MGPGQDPYGHQDDVPHFDRAAHERAQRRVDDRRAHRLARERGVNIDQPESATSMSFFGVAAILAVVVAGPFLLSAAVRNMASGNGGNASGPPTKPVPPGEMAKENASKNREGKEGKGR